MTTMDGVDIRYRGHTIITATVEDDGGPFFVCFTRTQSWHCDCPDDDDRCCHVLATIQTLKECQV
jgi:hypothetical protein